MSATIGNLDAHAFRSVGRHLGFEDAASLARAHPVARGALRAQKKRAREPVLAAVHAWKRVPANRVKAASRYFLQILGGLLQLRPRSIIQVGGLLRLAQKRRPFDPNSKASVAYYEGRRGGPAVTGGFNISNLREDGDLVLHLQTEGILSHAVEHTLESHPGTLRMQFWYNLTRGLLERAFLQVGLHFLHLPENEELKHNQVVLWIDSDDSGRRFSLQGTVEKRYRAYSALAPGGDQYEYAKEVYETIRDEIRTWEPRRGLNIRIVEEGVTLSDTEPQNDAAAAPAPTRGRSPLLAPGSLTASGGYTRNMGRTRWPGRGKLPPLSLRRTSSTESTARA